MLDRVYSSYRYTKATTDLYMDLIFEIVGADERVRKYLDNVGQPLPKHTKASPRHYFYGKTENE